MEYGGGLEHFRNILPRDNEHDPVGIFYELCLIEMLFE